MRKPWAENANNLLIVNAIFAALSGVMIGLVVQDTSHFEHTWGLPISLFGLSFVLFVLTAEHITDAMDENSVKKYVSYMLPYNAAVIFLFVGGGVLIHYRYFVPWPWVLLGALICSIRWLQDAWWLLRSDPAEFNRYLEGLDGTRKPERYETCLMKLFYGFVRKHNYTVEELPHHEVYTRLKPSSIHGVGVFANRPISKGTRLFHGDETEMVWIDYERIKGLGGDIRKLYDDFCIIKEGRYGCPRHFNELTMAWYLNESKEAPNVECREGYEFYALRDIDEGEELTIDYGTYSEYPTSA